ncbi:MAG: TraB/GumN family protein [Bacteroidota bacterium]|nr:TraB/GumN family protein [Bacteroidota bacterium]
MTLKTFSSLVFTIFLSTFIFGQENAQDRLANSLLWKIEGDSSVQPSYLFGTVHMIPEQDFLFTDSMNAVLSRCEQLILEIDINIPLIKQLQIAKKAFIGGGMEISDYMSEEEFRNFSAVMLDSLGVSNRTFKACLKMKPIYSMSLILNDLIKNPVQYEAYLNEKAIEIDIPVLGLESIDYQIAVIDSISMKEQIKMIRDQLAASQTMYEQMIEAYVNQDITRLHNYIPEESTSIDFQNSLLTNRNKNWIPEISKNIKTKPSFIAVGAGHLAGETGVINLLKKAGFKVSPVNDF